MDSIIVGIDVSKDRLDIALRPGGEAFVVERNAAGLERLVAGDPRPVSRIIAAWASAAMLRLSTHNGHRIPPRVSRRS
jgi:transposase